VQVVGGEVLWCDSTVNAGWGLDLPAETVMHARSGDNVWVVGHVGKDTVQVTLLNKSAGNVCAETLIPDEMTVSGLHLSESPAWRPLR